VWFLVKRAASKYLQGNYIAMTKPSLSFWKKVSKSAQSAPQLTKIPNLSNQRRHGGGVTVTAIT
jgi:hypothetical protein